MLKAKILLMFLTSIIISGCSPFSDLFLDSQSNPSHPSPSTNDSSLSLSFPSAFPQSGGLNSDLLQQFIADDRRVGATYSNPLMAVKSGYIGGNTENTPVNDAAHSPYGSNFTPPAAALPENMGIGSSGNPPMLAPAGETNVNMQHVGPEIPIKTKLQTPYDIPENERYAFNQGVHTLWVYNTDKAHSPNSQTTPRAEIAIDPGYSTSGKHEFEADYYIPQGTTDTCIMQVFGGASRATSFMLFVHDGNLTSYSDTKNPLATNIYDRWFRLNVLHDAANNVIEVYVDGNLVHTHQSESAEHNFKCGVYNLKSAPERNVVMIKNIRVYRSNE